MLISSTKINCIWLTFNYGTRYPTKAQQKLSFALLFCERPIYDHLQSWFWDQNVFLWFICKFLTWCQGRFWEVILFKLFKFTPKQGETFYVSLTRIVNEVSTYKCRTLVVHTYPGRCIIPATKTIPCPGAPRLHMLTEDFLFVPVMVWHPQLVLTASGGGWAAWAPPTACLLIYKAAYL